MSKSLASVAGASWPKSRSKTSSSLWAGMTMLSMAEEYACAGADGIGASQK
jgi:hypothetical protein